MVVIDPVSRRGRAVVQVTTSKDATPKSQWEKLVFERRWNPEIRHSDATDIFGRNMTNNRRTISWPAEYLQRQYALPWIPTDVVGLEDAGVWVKLIRSSLDSLLLAPSPDSL